MSDGASSAPAEAGDMQLEAESAENEKAKTRFGFELLKPGTSLHYALWTERSGRTLAGIISFFTWVFPLHGIENWPGWMILPIAAFFVVVAGWYPSAQANGLQRATSNEGSIDPNQANRDFGWSIWPTFPILVSLILTLVAWGLIIFQTHVFDDPRSHVISDRMIMSPAMAVMNAVFLWLVKVDLGNNNSVLSEFSQVAGRLTRFERPQH